MDNSFFQKSHLKYYFFAFSIVTSSAFQIVIPQISIRHDSLSRKILDKCESSLMKYQYSKLWNILDPLGEIQTIFTHVIRTIFDWKSIDYDREIVTLPNSEGTVAIEWTKHKDRELISKPLVILQHGLGGHSNSPYIKAAVKMLQKKGFYVVVFLARGCGDLKLTSPEIFAASRTSDFRHVVDLIANRYENRSIYAVGYSLGAAILLKYLGEEGQMQSSPKIKAAVALCPPWDFLIKTSPFERWSRFVLVQGLKDWLSNHLEFLNSHPKSTLNVVGMKSAKNVREFDFHAVVADKSLGFNTVDEYYIAASPIHLSKYISIPTLAISPHDDPVCSSKGCPDTEDKIGPGLIVFKTSGGGHLGYLHNLCWNDIDSFSSLFTRSFMDTAVVEFFKANELVSNISNSK